MNFIKKNRLLSAALMIELILLLLTAWDFFLPRFYLNTDASEIPFNGGRYENGCYVDEENGNAGYFTYGPYVTLPRGVFQITIRYETDADGNTAVCMGGNTTLRTLKYDEVTLSPSDTSVTFTLWSSKTVTDFQTVTVYGGQGSLTIKSIEIAETYAGSAITAFYVLFFGLIANAIILLCSYYRNHDIRNETIMTALVLMGVILFSSYPLMTDYMTEGHDLLFHLLRIEGIKDGLLSGQFPVKIQPTQLNGYGYAASVFYGDLFLYIPALFRLIGFSIQDSYMGFVFIINTASALICFYSFQSIFRKNNAALLGTVLYCLSPYRLINIYGRAAVGEYTAMTFIPLLALGLYKIFTEDTADRKYRRNWIIPAAAYTGIIESHILSCEMAGIFTILICLILIKRVFEKERFKVLVKVVVFTILANLGFLVPLADYMLRRICIISDGVMTVSNIQQNGLYAARLFTIFLNGDSMPYSRKANYDLGMQGEMGISAGIALFACFILFLYFMLIKHKKKNRFYCLGIFTWVLSAITLLMSLDIFPWDFLNDIFGDFVANIQFPWRFLGIGSLTMAIVAVCSLTFIIDNYKENAVLCFTALIMLTAILTSGWMLGDLLDNEAPFRIYSANALRTDTSGTYFNEYAPIDTEFESLDGQYRLSSDALRVSSYNKQYTNISAVLTNTSGSDQYIEFPLLYYPGYTALGSGGQLQCSSGDNNMVRVIIPADYDGSVSLSFKQPVFWIICEWISFLTICCLFTKMIFTRFQANAALQDLQQ